MRQDDGRDAIDSVPLNQVLGLLDHLPFEGLPLAVLGLLLVPGVFEVFADAVSLTQALRLKYFLPLAFALAGAATLLARWRFAGAGVALGAGVLLELVYPDNGPAWAVVLAVAGTLAALAVGAVRPTDTAPGTALWTAAAAVAFVVFCF